MFFLFHLYDNVTKLLENIVRSPNFDKLRYYLDIFEQHRNLLLT